MNFKSLSADIIQSMIVNVNVCDLLDFYSGK